MKTKEETVINLYNLYLVLDNNDLRYTVRYEGFLDCNCKIEDCKFHYLNDALNYINNLTKRNNFEKFLEYDELKNIIKKAYNDGEFKTNNDEPQCQILLPITITKIILYNKFKFNLRKNGKIEYFSGLDDIYFLKSDFKECLNEIKFEKEMEYRETKEYKEDVERKLLEHKKIRNEFFEMFKK